MKVLIIILLLGSAMIFFLLNRSNYQNHTSVNEISAQVENQEATLIDVRTTPEWNQDHALGATHFELQRLQNGELPELDKDTQIYVYCRSGNRSAQAKKILEQSGFKNVTNIGGLSDWKAKGGKTEQ